MPGRRLHISDRALLSFLQRVGGVDLDTVRNMLAESLGRAAVAAGELNEREFNIVADGFAYIVKDGALVGVLEHAPGARPRGKRL